MLERNEQFIAIFMSKVKNQSWDEIKAVPENYLFQTRDGNGFTALHYVGMSGDAELCELLANLFKDKTQVRAFFAGGAALSNNEEMTFHHLSRIEDAASREFATLHVSIVAVKQGHEKLVSSLLSKLNSEYHHQIGRLAEAKGLHDLAYLIFNTAAPAVIFSTMAASSTAVSSNVTLPLQNNPHKERQTPH